MCDEVYEKQDIVKAYSPAFNHSKFSSPLEI